MRIYSIILVLTFAAISWMLASNEKFTEAHKFENELFEELSQLEKANKLEDEENEEEDEEAREEFSSNIEENNLLDTELKLFSADKSRCGCPSNSFLRVNQLNETKLKNAENEYIEDLISRKKSSNVLMVDDMAFVKNTIGKSSNLWKNGLVFYFFDKSISARGKRITKRALRGLSKATNNCVKFHELSEDVAKNRDAVHVFKGPGCSSFIGKIGGNQKLSLGSGCLIKSIVQHEFMHALGIIHEQSRRDRDDHVKVHFQNIDSTKCVNFRKSRDFPLLRPYTTRSIMHYGSKAFSCGTFKRTLERKKGVKLIVQKLILSKGDVEMIKRLYKC